MSRGVHGRLAQTISTLKEVLEAKPILPSIGARWEAEKERNLKEHLLPHSRRIPVSIESLERCTVSFKPQVKGISLFVGDGVSSTSARSVVSHSASVPIWSNCRRWDWKLCYSTLQCCRFIEGIKKKVRAKCAAANETDFALIVKLLPRMYHVLRSTFTENLGNCLVIHCDVVDLFWPGLWQQCRYRRKFSLVRCRVLTMYSEKFVPFTLWKPLTHLHSVVLHCRYFFYEHFCAVRYANPKLKYEVQVGAPQSLVRVHLDRALSRKFSCHLTCIIMHPWWVDWHSEALSTWSDIASSYWFFPWWLRHKNTNIRLKPLSIYAFYQKWI